MNILRKNPFVKFFSIILAVVFFCTSCYTTRTVNDTSRPIYETKRVPVYEEVETVEYRKAQSPVFRGIDGRQVSSPIHLAVLDFYSRSGSRTINQSTITNSFYNKLIANTDAMNKFQLYSSDNLRTIFDVRELNPQNRSLLQEFSNMDIPFAVSAEVTNTRQPEFELSIYRTSNGISLFSHQFKTTSASNAIDDALRFMVLEELPYYGTSNQFVRYENEKIQTGYHTRDIRELDTGMSAAVTLIVGVLLIALIAEGN